MNAVELERIARSTIPPIKATGLCLVVDHEPGGVLANGAPSGMGGRTRFGPAWIIDDRVKSRPIALFDRQADAHRLLSILRGDAPASRPAPVIPAAEPLAGASPDLERTEAPEPELLDASLPGSLTAPEAQSAPSGIPSCGECGGPLPDEALTGRPRLTCSDACRQAYSRRNRVTKLADDSGGLRSRRAVRRRGVVTWNLDAFPEASFNRLLPTQTIQLPTDLLRPVVQVVKLNPDPQAGDVYASRDMPSGHAAPTKVGLRKLATAAGISIVDERRTDDGRDPDVIEVTCLAEMLLPTGQRITATGIKRVDLNAQVWSSDAHKGKFRSFFLEHVASRAQNRAIRALLSIRGSYPTQVYSRPFAVVSYAPNMNHPEIRARYLDNVAPVSASCTAARRRPRSRSARAGRRSRRRPAPEEDPAPRRIRP
jgi:hypothetical protein